MKKSWIVSSITSVSDPSEIILTNSFAAFLIILNVVLLDSFVETDTFFQEFSFDKVQKYSIRLK